MTSTQRKYDFFNLSVLESTKHIASGIYMVSPAIAQKMLGYNHDNRTLSKSTVSRYAKLMREGQWYISDSISIGENKKLLNGQHRLHAVIQSGVDIPFQITLNVPPEAALYYDQGKKRNAVDIANIQGRAIKPIHTSTIRAMGLSCHGDWFNSMQVLDLIEKYGEALDFALQPLPKDDTRQINKQFNNGLFKAAIAKGFYYENHARLSEFNTILLTGICKHHVEDSACIKLREEYLTSDSYTRRRSRKEWFAKIEKALFHFCAKKPIQKKIIPSVNPLYPLPDFDSSRNDANLKRMKQMVKTIR